MSYDASATRRYIAIYLPLLPAERLIRQHIRKSGKAPEGPFVLIEKQRGALVLGACNRDALALALIPGLPLADARARVPELKVFDHEPESDKALLEWLADTCGRYTPLVATQSSNGLILDISGCAHIWNDEAGLLDDLSQQLKRAGLTHVTAIAETPDKAWALACHGDERIRSLGDVRQLPVYALNLEPDGLKALALAGLRTIGDLASRPRRALAARLGIAAVTRLDRLLGYEESRITPRRFAPPLFAVRRFAEPIGHSDHVLETLRQLLVQLALALYEKAEGGRCFVATLYRSDGDIRSLTVETGAPTRDPALLLRLFRERIDALADPLDPGFGYDVIRADIARTAPLACSQKDALDIKRQANEDFGSLIDQLATRLGSAHVLRFVPGDSHLPELASTTIPAQQLADKLAWPSVETGEPPLRPLTLFDPPHPVEAIVTELPDGAPAAFRWRRKLHRVAYAEGPERIAALWWRRSHGYLQAYQKPDRDYYRIEDEQGRRFWLFRSGLYGETPAAAWYLHGAFA